MQLPNTNIATLDKLGMWISALCAVHCLVLPLIPLLLSSMLGQEWFEHTILIASMMIGAVALTNGALRVHGQYFPLALLLCGGVIYWFKGSWGDGLEPVAVTVGAALIIAGHGFNLRMSKKCSCCQSSTANA